MKRIGTLLSAVLIMLLTGCAREADTRKDVHDGANTTAVILSLDAERNEVAVKDGGSEGSFGEKCTLDCSDASRVYCDYETGEVREISLADLAVGDEVIILISASEIQNARTGRAKIDSSIQLSTQRFTKQDH